MSSSILAGCSCQWLTTLLTLQGGYIVLCCWLERDFMMHDRDSGTGMYSTPSPNVPVQQLLLTSFPANQPAHSSYALNRGIALPATSVAFWTEDDDLNGTFPLLQAYSAPAIVPLPIPDFSMPFNVACFTSIALSIIFASVLSVLLSDG